MVASFRLRQRGSSPYERIRWSPSSPCRQHKAGRTRAWHRSGQAICRRLRSGVHGVHHPSLVGTRGCGATPPGTPGPVCATHLGSATKGISCTSTRWTSSSGGGQDAPVRWTLAELYPKDQQDHPALLLVRPLRAKLMNERGSRLRQIFARTGIHARVTVHRCGASAEVFPHRRPPPAAIESRLLNGSNLEGSRISRPRRDSPTRGHVRRGGARGRLTTAAATATA